jgi:hypothetical protein
VSGQDFLHVVTLEPRVRHHDGGQAVPGLDVVEPARLADFVGHVPLGFHVDGAEDALVCGVAPVVLGQITPADHGVVTVAERRIYLTGEP